MESREFQDVKHRKIRTGEVLKMIDKHLMERKK